MHSAMISEMIFRIIEYLLPDNYTEMIISYNTVQYNIITYYLLEVMNSL